MTKKRSKKSTIWQHPFERMVPRIDINEIFNDVWMQTKNEMGIPEFVHGYNYNDEDFVRAIAYKALWGKSMAVSLNRLNYLLFNELGEEPRCIDAVHGRYRRKVPNASQVNALK